MSAPAAPSGWPPEPPRKPLTVNEGRTVQYPMVRHAEEVGWTPVDPWAALARRGGVSGSFFRDTLENKLAEFNPWLGADALRSVIETLDALPATIEGNREMLAWLRGERQWHDEAEQRHRPVVLIDFEAPQRNALEMSWEWTLKPPARKGNRADLMFLVNGIPAAIVEHKNPLDGNAIERAAKQLRRYELETPELLAAPQLFNVTHLLDYWYGATWSVNRRDIVRWKQTTDETYRFAVQSFFEPGDFLRTLQRWILFYVQDGETRKSVLRQHQRRAIDAVVARCADTAKTRGLVWHTQGSGKTFTLLTAAQLILLDKARFAHATVVLVVDRSELEGQLKGWVERLLGEMQRQDIAVRTAASKADLQALLDADFRGLIVSMIHKFDALRKKDSNTRENVFVFIDEAHRSVAHDLGIYLMAGLPRATVIGFTGTPIARSAQGEGTFKIFGAQDERGYLDKYAIVESIEDETTLPIKHVMAPSEMTVPAERLDQEFFALASAEGVSDIEGLNKVLDRAVGLRNFLAADDRIERVAAFVAEHYRENVLPLGYKAFVVAVNREACAKYKQAFDRLLPPNWSEAVYSANASDAIDRPLVAELQLSDEREADVRQKFKKPAEEPRILIVTDKLLTGFDAPLLYCLYLDKPMRDHVLLQAIARVNRPYVDAQGVQKRIGLVVDFVGVLRELKKALQFDSEDVSGAIEDLDVLLQDFLRKMEAARSRYLAPPPVELSPDAQLEHRLGRFTAPDARQALFDGFQELQALWEILSPSPELRDHIEPYKELAQLYVAVRNWRATAPQFVADLAYKTRRLIEGSAEQFGLGRLTKSVTFDVATLQTLRDQAGSDEGKVYNLLRGLQQELDQSPDTAALLRPIQERAQQVLHNLETRRTAGLAAMDELAALAAEKEAALRAARASGLSARAFSVYWALRNEAEVQAARLDLVPFAREADALLVRFPNADVNADEKRRLRAALYKPLLLLQPDARARCVDLALRLLIGDPLA